VISQNFNRNGFTELTRTEVSVLRALAMDDNDSDQAWLYTHEISHKTSYNNRSVNQALKTLSKLGFVEFQEYRTDIPASGHQPPQKAGPVQWCQSGLRQKSGQQA